MTELEFTGTKYAGEDGNAISGRGAYTGATTGTAFVINVPESMTGISVINLDKGQSVYPNVNGLRFRIILNDTVLQGFSQTGTTGADGSPLRNNAAYQFSGCINGNTCRRNTGNI